MKKYLLRKSNLSKNSKSLRNLSPDLLSPFLLLSQLSLMEASLWADGAKNTGLTLCSAPNQEAWHLPKKSRLLAFLIPFKPALKV